MGQRKADQARRAPRAAKLASNQALREEVEQRLQRRESPEQIAGRLRRDFPDDPEMQVCAETIYQSLYVQSRGGLRRELTACLRTGRAIRKPHRREGERRGRIPDMVMISERPAEAESLSTFLCKRAGRGSQVGLDSVGVGEFELGEGLLPVGGDLAFDETA